MAERGMLLTIEGGDGSGKATQAGLTQEYGESIGMDVMKESFPRYGEKSAEVVERLLRGEFGHRQDGTLTIPPEFLSYAFAVDRLAGTAAIKKHLRKSKRSLVILDRYTGSNSAYQAANFETKDQRLEYMLWNERMEHEDLGMPIPRHSVILNVPSQVSYENVGKKDARSYTADSHDINEVDVAYQERVRLAYSELGELFPDRYTPINCMDHTGNMRPPEDIQLDIRDAFGLNERSAGTLIYFRRRLARGVQWLNSPEKQAA